MFLREHIDKHHDTIPTFTKYFQHRFTIEIEHLDQTISIFSEIQNMPDSEGGSIPSKVGTLQNNQSISTIKQHAPQMSAKYHHRPKKWHKLDSQGS